MSTVYVCLGTKYLCSDILSVHKTREGAVKAGRAWIKGQSKTYHNPPHSFTIKERELTL